MEKLSKEITESERKQIFSERNSFCRLYFSNSIIKGVLLISLWFSVHILTASQIDQSPFWTDKIEVDPGGILILHPRLPYIEGLRDEEYTLTLDLPSNLKISPLQILGIDSDSRINPVSETILEFEKNGEMRQELSYVPDLSAAKGGSALFLRYPSREYIPFIEFSGTFDWKTFRRKISVHDECLEIRPLLWSYPRYSTITGTLSLKSLSFVESDSGNTIFSFHPPTPLIAKNGEVHWLSQKGIKLLSGKNYLIECQAKGEGLQSQHASVKDIFAKKVLYARTFVFKVDPHISLPGKLFWQIKGNGKIYKQGEITLVAPRKRIAPKRLDCSVWLCESSFGAESLPIQRLYVEKLHSWGLNTVEPQMHMPAYKTPLTKELLVIPSALEAKRLGMRIRAYMHFLYVDGSFADYLATNPQYAAIGPQGNKFSRICPTHYLEKGNPWLSYYLDVIKKSTKENSLDGVFYDFEINAAPYIKSRPQKNGSRRWSNTCMCERCRQVFKNYVKLDHIPSVEECCDDKLYEKWVDFRCLQNIQLWELTKNAAKSVNPHATLGLYSGPPGNYSRQAYGVDWGMVAPYLDFAMQRYHCPFSQGASSLFQATLKKEAQGKRPSPKMLFQIGAFPYPDEYLYGVNVNKIYTELPNIKNNIIRTVAVYGSYGWSFNGIWGIDDQFTLPVKEANAILAKYEDFFIIGEKVNNSILLKKGDVEITTWQNGNRKVTFVFNKKVQPQEIVLVRKLNHSHEVRFKVNANDCYVYEWPQ